MSKTLTKIAEELRDADGKVQLIYAFNGSGKTRLSQEFKELISPKTDDDETEDRKIKVLYYNAFTEDLFYWDNDLEGDSERKLKIQSNAYTKWVLQEQGQDQNVIDHFQIYTGDKLTPYFDANFSEVTFSFERGNDERTENIKISKGEESSFIWSIFYTLLDQVINTLSISDLSERETDKYDQLKYVFIDDPVTSLDENHLIELAVNMAKLINSSESGLKFIITTHSPLFYNVLYSELKPKIGYILSRFDDGSFELEEKKGASNTAFSYHLHIKNLIEQAIKKNNVQRYHFTLLRNLYEKTAAFFGYKEWTELLPGDEKSKNAYLRRIINFSSHSKLSNEETTEPTPPEKKTVKFLLDNLINNYGPWPK
jgi:energy-coupling factor transporter ATP-binding protein EcfA2